MENRIGILLGIRADKLEINVDGLNKVVGKIIIGIYEKKLSRTNEYNALIGLDILESARKKKSLR